jgi:hypothetical protein
MLIRIPVPGALVSGTEYVLEFDPDKIDSIEMNRPVMDVPGDPGRKEFTGRASLILHFATLEDAPRWVEAEGP